MRITKKFKREMYNALANGLAYRFDHKKKEDRRNSPCLKWTPLTFLICLAMSPQNIDVLEASIEQQYKYDE